MYRVVDLFVFIITVIFFFYKFLFSSPEIYYFYADDFFYYLKIAENIYDSGVSTFNGIHKTNGYHPLWLLTLTGLNYLGSKIFVLYSVAILQVLSSLISYTLLKKIFNSFIDSDLSLAFSLILLLQILLIEKSGMEIIFSIPLMLFVIKRFFVDNRTNIFFYLFMCLMVLSRLDGAILAILVILHNYYKSDNKKKEIMSSIIGFIPFFLYLIYNYKNYGHILPVSGAAKQLSNYWFASFNSVKSIFDIYPGRVIYGVIPFLLILVNIIFFNQLKLKHKILTSFPIISLLYYSTCSGWGLWSWYFYIFIPSTIVFTFLFSNRINQYKRAALILSIFFFMSWTSVNILLKRPSNDDYFLKKLELVEFMKPKKGIVAMGDAAGLPGYLLNNPVIQLEGLVMDYNYLEKLKQQKLNMIFKDYQVDYYITISSKQKDSMWQWTEPWYHHPRIINCTYSTKETPLFSTGNGWLDFRVWQINSENLINK